MPWPERRAKGMRARPSHPGAVRLAGGLRVDQAMRALLATAVIIHALIHLMGFVGEFWPGKVEGIPFNAHPPPWRQWLGLAWLIVTLLLFAAASGFMLRWHEWWRLGVPAVLLSQGLILAYWSEAKFGTLANLLLLVPLLAAFGASRFDSGVDRDIDRLLRSARGNSAVVEERDLGDLPVAVARWLRRAGVLGAPRARVNRLTQVGLLRTEPEGAWMPAVAHQYFSIDPPAFVWRTRVSMMRILPVEGCDRYLDGRGHMLITIGGIVPVVDVRGEEIDQGTLLRFLGEIVWTPSASLSPYIRWEHVDETHARATMSFGGVSASGVFEFDELGRHVSMEARRYMGGGAEAVLADWHVRSTEWQRFGGIEVPSKGEVLWKLPAGDFSYYQWEITEVSPDQPERYDSWRRD